MKKLLSLLLVLCVAALPALSLAEAQTEIIRFRSGFHDGNPDGNQGPV